MMGPVGIVHVMQHQWMVSLNDALFWLGMISLNLGLLNLLPLPILDGGYIALSVFEMITRRRLKAKTIEKIVVPFAILLILFFVFLTYNDIIRIVSNLFRS
jgi:regulator of sigma E protease